MPCSANSIAISDRAKVRHEKTTHWPERCESTPHWPDSGWDLPCFGAESRLSSENRKPYYTIDVVIAEPTRFLDRIMSSRIYCNPRALWKLNWFLRDFAYDPDLLERDEIDEKRLIGLRGVVKVSRIVFDGTLFLRFDGFAPAEKWQELSPANLDTPLVP